MRLRVDEILKASQGELLKGNIDSTQYSFSTDTRKINKGDIYIPLKGANFDGENFIQDAVKKGAIGCFTTGNHANVPLAIKVDNTLETYMKICEYYLKKQKPIVIGITGSSGKTTTKEILYSVLSEKFKTHKTFSNHNNEIGFCETVATMPDKTEIIIIEMGMRGLGEINLIAKHAHPNIGIITNVGSAHLGRLGSVDNIAKAKCELSSHIKDDGIFISLNQRILRKHNNFKGESIFYSIEDVDIIEKKPSYTKFRYKGYEYEINIEGNYNIENSLSAIEAALKLGMKESEIANGLKKYKPIEKRWEIEVINDFKIINDSYNANPESMKASVSTFMELYQNSVIVLGDMGELGEQEIPLHKEVGAFLSSKQNSASFITVGKLASKIGEELSKKGGSVTYCNNNYEAARYILENVNVGTTIFLKASRSMKFEEILDALRGDN